LQTFSMNDEQSIYDFEGKVYGQEETVAPVQEFIDLGARERKIKYTTYDVEHYFKETLNPNQKPKSDKESKPRLTGWKARANGGYDFQFFNNEELDRLDAKEKKWTDHVEGNEEDSNESDETNGEHVRGRRGDAKSKVPEFTASDEKQRNKLLQEGYSNWTKKDFGAFIRGCEKYGRKDAEKISNEICTKTPKEVREYSKAFWSKIGRLEKGERYLERVEKGEADLEKRTENFRVLEYKFENHKEIAEWNSLTLNYSLYKANVKTKFSEEEDRFLLCCLYKYGLDNWAVIRNAFQMCPLFYFNWVTKARPTQDFQRRCDYLLNILRKEKERDIQKKKEALRKKKITRAKTAPILKSNSKKPTTKSSRKQAEAIEHASRRSQRSRSGASTPSAKPTTTPKRPQRSTRRQSSTPTAVTPKRQPERKTVGRTTRNSLSTTPASEVIKLTPSSSTRTTRSSNKRRSMSPDGDDERVTKMTRSQTKRLKR